jgi:uncharacterized protein (DUF2147 family)
MGLVSRFNRSLGAATVSFLTILGSLAAAAETSDAVSIEGRWKAEGRDLVLDIRSCGDKVCGHLVTTGSACGAMILTVGLAAEPRLSGGGPDYIGDINVPSDRAYKVRVSAGGNPARLYIRGGETVPSLFQRSFPLHLVLSRTGDPGCTPRATS